MNDTDFVAARQDVVKLKDLLKARSSGKFSGNILRIAKTLLMNVRRATCSFVTFPCAHEHGFVGPRPVIARVRTFTTVITATALSGTADGRSGRARATNCSDSFGPCAHNVHHQAQCVELLVGGNYVSARGGMRGAGEIPFGSRRCFGWCAGTRRLI
uniref:Uncharacterized protein n=1 Tax=Sipha flava TaxID=143950 RepID=A0A2S2Q7U7_9HEMI